MPHFTLFFQQSAPFLEVTIGPSYKSMLAYQQSGQQPPRPRRIRGLIDTGASHTCVDPAVLFALGLQAIGSVQMHTASTGFQKSRTDVFNISLLIQPPATDQEPLTIPTLRVHATELSAVQNFDALIGRDVLQHCVLTYNGSMGWFTLAY